MPPLPPRSPQSRGILPLVLLIASFAAMTSPRAAGADEAGAEFFEKRVRPILAERCFECHSEGAKKLRANLHLDSRAGMLQGGDHGPAIVPGDIAASRLVKAIHWTDDHLQMPPKAKLPADAIADLTRWVEMGAPWPGGDEPRAAPASANRFDLAQRKAEHWAWQPVKAVTPPTVKQADWPADDLDRFILAALEEKGMKPAGAADRHTLLRRVYFDLIGLPPTPEEVRAFIADDSPGAYAAVVDRLLASPHFGERWGRHWLDLVRYAETFGHEFDYAIPHAWRYRDYIIRALNADVPYDRLIHEHVAGDLLPDPRLHPTEGTNESILATGMWFMHEQTHAPVDARLHLADRIDNQLDVLSKTFLGVTVSCARCHDHKFDAISTKDYYALYGYFLSSRMQVTPLDVHGRIAAGVKQLAELRRQGEALLSPALAAAPSASASAAAGSTETFTGFDHEGWGEWRQTGWAFGDGPTRGGEWDCAATEARALPRGLAHSGLLADRLPGTLASPTFTLKHPWVHFRVAGKGRVRVVVNGYKLDESSGLLFSGLIQKVDSPGKFRWVTAGKDLNKYVGHRAHIELIDDGPGSLIVDEIRFSSEATPPKDTVTTIGEAVTIGDDLRPRLDSLRRQMDEAAAGLPEPVMALAMADGNGVDEHVFIRGFHRSLGERAPRRFLEALGGEAQPAGQASSGRLELARQITDPANPLTARVMVNRIWHHLMGRGIAASVDNLGVLGQPPTHPELLDHLARRFVAGGWSIKQMIRAIVMSRTYRMASAALDARNEEADPQNLLLHRMNVKRLEGEVIRDALLAVSGRLDRTMHGPPVPIHLTPFMEGRGRPKDSGPLDGEGRRSIYISVRRNFLSPMMLAFDTPQPFQTVGRRTVSNVPAQALILMNDPLVIQQARRWAEAVLATEGLRETQRIERLYLTAFGRAPTQAESTEAAAFLQQQRGDASESQAWSDLCHVLMNVKEFIFVY